MNRHNQIHKTSAQRIMSKHLKKYLSLDSLDKIDNLKGFRTILVLVINDYLENKTCLTEFIFEVYDICHQTSLFIGNMNTRKKDERELLDILVGSQDMEYQARINPSTYSVIMKELYFFYNKYKDSVDPSFKPIRV